MAMEEGLQMALYQMKVNLTVEMDCTQAVQLVPAEGLDPLQYTHLVNEIRRLMCDERDIDLVKIDQG